MLFRCLSFAPVLCMCGEKESASMRVGDVVRENYFTVEASDVSQDGIERECVITACSAAATAMSV
jgi:hypothetical protein